MVQYGFFYIWKYVEVIKLLGLNPKVDVKNYLELGAAMRTICFDLGLQLL